MLLFAFSNNGINLQTVVDSCRYNISIQRTHLEKAFQYGRYMCSGPTAFVAVRGNNRTTPFILPPACFVPGAGSQTGQLLKLSPYLQNLKTGPPKGY